MSSPSTSPRARRASSRSMPTASTTTTSSATTAARSKHSPTTNSNGHYAKSRDEPATPSPATTSSCVAPAAIAPRPREGGHASHGDDDLSLSVSFSHVPEGIRDLVQLVTPVDDRFHLPGFEQVSQDDHVGHVELRDEEKRPLAAGY